MAFLKKKEARHALLKGRLTCAMQEADDFLDALAARIKEHDGPNQPIGAIRNSLMRGDHCLCRTALRILAEDGE